MNKKYLSVILFGALMLGTTGTFTSCKDYDDDITNLQTQINNLATKQDMEAKLSQMQASIDAAKTAADAAMAKAQEALTKAEAAGDQAAIENLGNEIDALETRVKALEDAAIDVEALKSELKTATEDQLDGFRTEMESLIEQVEGLVGKLADMVTSVELVTSFTANPVGAYPVELSFTTANEQDNVFEEDIANAITFKKGNQVQTPSTFIVRVSPTNAALTPEMISLVNSQGKNLDDMVTIKSVKKFSGLLTRAAENSGLWEVEVELTKYDKDEFAAASKTNAGKSILYAVQVNNTPTAEETASRYVTSSYDLTLDWNKYVPEKTLNYFVNDKNIKDINNRYALTYGGSTPNKSLPHTVASEDLAPEYKWKNETAVVPITPATAANSNVVEDTNDDRSDKDAYPAIQGEDIVISLTTSPTEIVAPEKIRAMYVTLDYEKNAVESAPSEWNAWNSYKYTGLNSVVEGTEVTITINPGEGQTIIDDYIGFRVYAVNYDGTLVDPDGKAFYVKVGNPAQDWNAVNTVIIPDAKNSTLPTTEQSADEAVTLTKLTGAVKATWVTDKIGTNEHVFDAVFEGQGISFATTSLSTTASSISSSIDFSKLVKVHTVPTITDWTQYVDNKTYNGTLTIYNADDFVLATINVSMTKQLPTAPKGFSVKTNQLDANGVYNCYLVPDTWTAPNATKGTMDMDDVFNWGAGESAQYVISFANAKKASGKDVANEVAGTADLEVVAEDYIDNKTQHATTVYYDFGQISSETKDASGNIINYRVAVTTFPTVFNCIYNDTYTWHWGTAEEVKEKYPSAGWTGKNAPITELEYGSDYTFATPNGAAYSFDAVIVGASSRDGKYSAWLDQPYQSSLQFVEAHVISKGNGVEDEYFEVDKDSSNRLYFKATAISENTNPTANVPSTLKLVYKDMYDHDVVIELDMTVVPR